MRLYQRGKTWWVDLRAEGGARVSTGETDRRKAEAAARRLLNGVGNGHTLADAFDRAWSEHYAGTKGERNVRSQMNVLRAEAKRTKLSEIDTRVIGNLTLWLRARGCTTPTINRYLALVGRVLKLACEWGWLDAVPHIPRGKESEHRIRVLTQGEEVTLLFYFNAHHTGMLDLVPFLLDTGARLSEALAITMEDRVKALESGRWTIWVNKGNRPRTLPLTHRAKAALNHWGWSGMTARQCQAAWDRARAKMGLADDPGFVIHALRHTCATRLVDNGVALPVIRDWLGHSTVAVTERYAHLNPASLEQAKLCLESVPSGEYDGAFSGARDVTPRDLSKGYGAGGAKLRLVASGGETVNLTAQPSEVQILPPPPIKTG